MVSRKEQELRAIIPNVDSSEEYQSLISLVYKQGQYWMYHAKSLNDDSFKNHADRVWRIVKYETYLNKKSNTFKVIEGDTIKFGRVRFRIRKLVIDKNDIESLNGDEINDMTSIPSRPGGIHNDSVTQNQLRQLTTLENDNMSAL